MFLKTRPAMSKVEPWQGHRKPPRQSLGKDGCGPVWKLVGGRAAQVRADADDHQDIGLDGAVLVARVDGSELVGMALGLRICQLGIVEGQVLELLGGALDDPYRLAAPLDRELLALLDRRDIDLYRSPCRLGFFRRLKRAQLKGTAVATPPTAPAHAEAIIQVRLLESTAESLMDFLEIHRFEYLPVQNSSDMVMVIPASV